MCKACWHQHDVWTVLAVLTNNASGVCRTDVLVLECKESEPSHEGCVHARLQQPQSSTGTAVNVTQLVKIVVQGYLQQNGPKAGCTSTYYGITTSIVKIDQISCLKTTFTTNYTHSPLPAKTSGACIRCTSLSSARLDVNCASSCIHKPPTWNSFH